jgi:uncharacterized protein (TIGR03435 family)
MFSLNCKRTLAALCLLTACCTAQTPATTPTSPQFEVAVVRPNPTALRENGFWSQPNTGSFNATGIPLTLLIHLAYGIDTRQIVNQPKWLDTKLFDITAKPEPGIKLSRAELQPRLQNLLAQRFHLVVHRETRDIAGYALIVAKHGPHLQPTKHATMTSLWSEVHPGKIMGMNWTLDTLAKSITSVIDKPVINRTAIPGSYDIDITYAPDTDTDSPLPPLFTALEETLGLRLAPQKLPVEFLFIDSVNDTPTDN